MRLTSFTDFALCALMRMAAQTGCSFTTDEIAREFAISRHHLTKVVRDLARTAFVAAQRGGLRLACPPQEIRVGAVVRALERRETPVECSRPDGGGCRMTAGCVLTGRLAGARETLLRHLDATTQAECAWAPERA
jgi:Rrf2 family nitric oxide-sensitive transcriptional repressor